MSLIHQIKIGYETSEKVEISLSDDDLQVLEEFVDHARKLEQCSLVQSGMFFSFNFQFNENLGAKSEIAIPDWELVEVYLHRIRPIILTNERTYFFRVCKLIKKNISLPKAQQQVAKEMQLYRGEKIHQIVQIYSNGELLTCEEIFQDYLNGFEYHRDKDRRDNLEKLNWLLPIESTRVLWYWLLQEKGASIIRVAEWIRRLSDVVRQRETNPLNIHLLSSQ